jgi:hypothetical protein
MSSFFGYIRQATIVRMQLFSHILMALVPHTTAAAGFSRRLAAFRHAP